jgi:SAM-dependent methyltransferase
MRGDDAGRPKLERSLALAEEADLETDVGRAYINLACAFGMCHRWALVDRYVDPGIRFCRERGLDVLEGGLPDAPFTGPFDVTIAQHVIEHVPDPRPFVGALVRLTRPGGVVVIVTEDAWNTQYAWERARARLRGHIPMFRSSFDHTFVFSATHLDRLMRAAGCDDVRTCSFSYVPPREAWHWRAYKGTFRTLDRALGHGEFLMAAGRVASGARRTVQGNGRQESNR